MRTIRQTLQKMKKKSSGADHLTFVGGRGGMGDLVWVRIFPPNLGDRISSLTYNSVRLFFPVLYTMRDIFFSAGIFFP